MDKKLSLKRKVKNDIVLAVVIVLLATAGLLLFNLTKTTGDYVLVKIDGVEKYRYSLAENIDMVVFNGENDEFWNRIVISDGTVCVSEANCPDKICVGHRKINKDNESIVCLPHKVVVEVVSVVNTDEPDVVM